MLGLCLAGCSEDQLVRLGDGLSGGAAGTSGSAGADAGGNGGSAGSAAGSGGSGGNAGESELQFGAPSNIDDPVEGHPEAKVDDPSLTGDLLQLFFNADLPDDETWSEDIWVIQRTAPNEGWGGGDEVDELNTEHRETGIAVAANGLTIWFSSDRDNPGEDLDVYVATRQDPEGVWDEPVRIPSLSTDADDLVSGITSDELTLTLALREAPNNYDIYYSTRSSKDAEWPAATTFEGDLNTSGKDGDASLSADGLSLIFTRGPDGGHGDLFRATRSSKDARFGSDNESPLGGVNTECDERDPWVSEDLSYIIFASNQNGCTEDRYELFEAYR